MRHALAMAIACVLLCLISGTRLALADTGIPMGSVTSLVTDLGGASVTVRIPFPPGYSRAAAGDPFLDFSIPADPMKQPASIAAYLPGRIRGGVMLLSSTSPTSTWEITPADYENGLGGYVRLYLPADIGQFADAMGFLEVIICSASVDLIEFTSGVSDGKLFFVPRVSEESSR